MLLRKHRNVFADLSARFHRPWQLYNGLVVALEYGVGTSFCSAPTFPSAPLRRRSSCSGGLRDMVKGTNLPQITDHMIDWCSTNGH